MKKDEMDKITFYIPKEKKKAAKMRSIKKDKKNLTEYMIDLIDTDTTNEQTA